MSKGVQMSTKATSISRIVNQQLLLASRLAETRKSESRGVHTDTQKSKTAAKKAEAKRRKAQAKAALERAVVSCARFLVVYDGNLIASFAREDDALLYEAELADLDRGNGVEAALCEVLDRAGRRVGGYFITAGKMVAFLDNGVTTQSLNYRGFGL